MGTAIALLSGKGGSGKTTLSLCIANLLASCKIKTLLIDCDMSTNGASFFYESFLRANHSLGNTIRTFSDLLTKEYCFATFANNTRRNFKAAENESLITPIVMREYLDFFPSVTTTSVRAVRNSKSIDYSDSRISATIVNFIQAAKDSYDIVLFDCQAGYAGFFPFLLPEIDTGLFVLETDSVSAAALRNLYLKVGHYLEGAKLYQVFNKAAKEEYDIYSKIDGTILTNIGTLCFDWEIRQAFSRSQIPDLLKLDSDYGITFCEACKVLFPEPEIATRIEYYQKFLKHNANERKQEKLLNELSNLSEEHKKSRVKILFAITTLILALMSAVLMWIELKNTISNYSFILFLTVIIVPLLTLIMFEFSSDPSRENRKLIEAEIDKLTKEQRALQKALSKASPIPDTQDSMFNPQ